MPGIVQILPFISGLLLIIISLKAVLIFPCLQAMVVPVKEMWDDQTLLTQGPGLYIDG
jgi:hypothetical protein